MITLSISWWHLAACVALLGFVVSGGAAWLVARGLKLRGNDDPPPLPARGSWERAVSRADDFGERTIGKRGDV